MASLDGSDGRKHGLGFVKQEDNDIVKRGCVLRIWDDETAREAMQEAVSELCRRLFYEADIHEEKPHLQTLEIKCRRDIDPKMIMIEGTIESSSRMLEYREIMQMYLDDRYKAKKDGDGE